MTVESIRAALQRPGQFSAGVPTLDAKHAPGFPKNFEGLSTSPSPMSAIGEDWISQIGHMVAQAMRANSAELGAASLRA